MIGGKENTSLSLQRTPIQPFYWKWGLPFRHECTCLHTGIYYALVDNNQWLALADYVSEKYCGLRWLESVLPRVQHFVVWWYFAVVVVVVSRSATIVRADEILYSWLPYKTLFDNFDIKFVLTALNHPDFLRHVTGISTTARWHLYLIASCWSLHALRVQAPRTFKGTNEGAAWVSVVTWRVKWEECVGSAV